MSFAAASFADVVDSNTVFRVDEIRYNIGDAFDDSKAHTKYDRWAYDILNWVHIETRESTVRKLLLFDKGDLVNLDLLLWNRNVLCVTRNSFLTQYLPSRWSRKGKNVVTVQTSDNWTLTIPFALGFSGSEWSYDNLVWGIGVQESNFLGLGQKLGFYFGHDEFRDMWQVEYGDPHFLFRYNHLDFLYSYNTDGYLASWKMYVPFLSRSVNQWAYMLEGLKNKRYYFLWQWRLARRGTVTSPTELPDLDSLQQLQWRKDCEADEGGGLYQRLAELSVEPFFWRNAAQALPGGNLRLLAGNCR